MGNVYSITQKNLADGLLDLDGHVALKARAILDTVLPVFGENDLTMTDVMANSDGGGAITKSIEAEVLLTGVITAQVTNGVDLSANKVLFVGVLIGETWAVIIIYDATTDTNDGTRIPIAFYDVTDTPTNGSDIEILWSGTDGVGIYGTTRNS